MRSTTDGSNKFGDIIKLCNEIDDLLSQKGGDKFELRSIGHEMMKSNSEFYQSGVDVGKNSFSTLATEPENKRDLAMSFLANIYSAWTIQNKSEFNVLEIGAGSGDLIKEIFAIRNEVLESESSSKTHKDFFKSLKFNIVDFPEMIKIQKEKLGEDAKNVNFIEHDISKELLPSASFDVIYGNEIPDTQRVDFLEVKKDDKTGEKRFFLRALKKMPSGETSEVLAGISSSPEIIAEIGKNLFPIDELEPGVYKLQFGFHALMHNIKQSVKSPYGTFILTDYFDFKKKFSTRDLSFAGIDGSSHEEVKKFLAIGEPGKQLIEAKNMYGANFDVTYPPNVGRDTCDLFSFYVSSFSVDDRSKVIVNLKFKSLELIDRLGKDPLFGEKFMFFLEGINLHDRELMPTELSQCRKLIKIQQEQEASPGVAPSSGVGSKAKEQNNQSK